MSCKKQVKKLFVTGTDTEVGKTLVSLALCLKFSADYWKPVQTGTDTDSDFIKKFIPSSRVHPSSYELKAPVSPNQAAQKEQSSISLDSIQAPQTSAPLIVEGIGGVYVPFNERENVRDLILKLGFPVLVVARSGLGTLNHTLLTLLALRQLGIEPLGLVLSGEPHKENKRDLEKLGKVPVLLELPLLDSISASGLMACFEGFELP